MEKKKNLLISEIKVFDKYIDTYLKRLSRDRGVSWLLSVVGDLAKQEKVKITSIKPGSSKVKKEYSKLYITLETVSKYYQLGKFISRIESSEKFLKIESLELKRIDSSRTLSDDVKGLDPFDVTAHIIITTTVWRD